MFFKNLGTKFEYLAKIYGHNICLEIDGTKTSFKDLNEISNQIANFFLIKKFKKNTNISISLKKSKFCYAIIIACLKLGISYTFLDRKSPLGRVKKILKSLKSITTISETKMNIKTNNLILKDLQNKIIAQSKTISPSILANVESSTVAYVMFTSGSTGFPKGVAIRHYNVLAFSEWCKNEFGINSDETVTNLNSLFFDNSIFDIFGGLFNGARLIPFHRVELLDSNLVKRIVLEKKITIWFSVPSLLVYLINFKKIDKNFSKNLKKIIFGGEGFPKSKLLDLYNSVKKKTELINVYGPTECTCICSSYKISSYDFKKDQIKKFAPLGKKLAKNFYMLILNKENKIVKQGEIGELVIGGKNVGAGYYNLKKETKKNFIINPFTKKNKDIVYRSGDLVYQDKIKNIYFVSRKDNQIKYMGYRIELEEIEQVIGKISNVKECAVGFGKKDGNQKIVCWISHKTNINRILTYLEKQLPKYMFPNKFIELNILPKNNNGKIDRKKLIEDYFDGK